MLVFDASTLETKAPRVATDDRNALRACGALGLKAVTALAVLVRATQKGLLSPNEAERRLKDLAQHGRYASDVLDEARPQLRVGG